MPAPASPAELLDLVRRSGVVTDEALDRITAAPALPETPGKLAAALVKQGLLTPFQAKLLLAGKHRGFRLGSYVVRDQIGQGGMGAVYLAEHETLKRRVALKVLTADKDKLALARFLREARAAAALDHPNIVRLYDVAKHGDLHYLTLEYVEGETLEARLARSGPLPYSQVVDWTAQVAAGLQHAHETGFVHRDIKPANLIITKAGQVKILDMGLARSGDDRDKLTEMMDKGAVVGTADFIAPEQAVQGVCDIRADIYALGATFYTMVAGKPPFEGTTTQKLLFHQMRDPPRLDEVVADFPPELADVVARMMAKRPDDRFQTPAELVDALLPWVPPSSSARLAATLGASGSTSAVNLGNPQTAQSGVSTKRLAPRSAKTDPSPAAATRRRDPAASTGRLDRSVTTETETSPRSGKLSGKRKKKGKTPSWVLIAVAAGGGFLLVGTGAALVLLLSR